MVQSLFCLWISNDYPNSLIVANHKKNKIKKGKHIEFYCKQNKTGLEQTNQPILHIGNVFFFIFFFLLLFTPAEAPTFTCHQVNSIAESEFIFTMACPLWLITIQQ